MIWVSAQRNHFAHKAALYFITLLQRQHRWIRAECLSSLFSIWLWNITILQVLWINIVDHCTRGPSTTTRAFTHFNPLCARRVQRPFVPYSYSTINVQGETNSLDASCCIRIESKWNKVNPHAAVSSRRGGSQLHHGHITVQNKVLRLQNVLFFLQASHSSCWEWYKTGISHYPIQLGVEMHRKKKSFYHHFALKSLICEHLS